MGIFCAPANGAHGKSDDPRSELKHHGHWDLKTPATHTLTAKVAVMHVSKGGGPVIGQIHGLGSGEFDQLLKLRCEKDGTVKAMFKDKTGKGASYSIKKINFGEEFAYTIKHVVEKDKSTVYVTVDGETKVYAYDFFSPGDKVLKTHYYFKAGSYSDIDTSSRVDSDGCVVQISSLQTSNPSSDQSPSSAKLCSDTGKPPAMDLRNWVLEEPAGHGMKIVSNLNSHHDEFLHGGGTGSAIFCTPGNGGTSTHAKDPRSELREQHYDMAIEKGTYRFLKATVKVLHLSPSSKALVVVGQIHATGNGFGSEVEMNQLLKLHVKNNGDVEAEVKDKDGKGTLANGSLGQVKEGAELTYTIQLDYDQLTVTANGKEATYDYSWLPDKVKKTKYWFKAGSYCDPGDEKYFTSSEGCIVEFLNITSQHKSGLEEVVV